MTKTQVQCLWTYERKEDGSRREPAERSRETEESWGGRAVPHPSTTWPTTAPNHPRPPYNPPARAAPVTHQWKRSNSLLLQIYTAPLHPSSVRVLPLQLNLHLSSLSQNQYTTSPTIYHFVIYITNFIEQHLHQWLYNAHRSPLPN